MTTPSLTTLTGRDHHHSCQGPGCQTTVEADVDFCDDPCFYAFQEATWDQPPREETCDMGNTPRINDDLTPMMDAIEDFAAHRFALGSPVQEIKQLLLGMVESATRQLHARTRPHTDS